MQRTGAEGSGGVPPTAADAPYENTVMDADNPDIGFTWPGSMAVETGAIVNGVEVPARRAFFGFVGNDGAASLNADGVAVWDALITWLLTN